MSKIVHLQKRLSDRPIVEIMPDVTIRPFNSPGDVDAWLRLRDAAMAGLIARGRPWTNDDFRREFAASRLWVAEPVSRERQRPEEELIGAVALGRAGIAPHERASLQWLMVAPAHRRRGVGKALITTVEQAAWDAGDRRLSLETHLDWRDAIRLYERCGYSPVR